MPSAVASRVAVNNDSALRNPSSATDRAVMSWAEMMNPPTVGSSIRLTMVSSKGTVSSPVWRRRRRATVTGFAADAPRPARSKASASAGRSGPSTMSARGRCSTSSGSCPSSRMRAPETDSTTPSAQTNMVTAAEF